MKTSTCSLCLTQNSVLQESHLMPRFAYRIASKKIGGPLTQISTKGLVRRDNHIKDYLLCFDCEQRLNKNGELWLSLNCWRSPKEFKMRDSAMAILSKLTEPVDCSLGGLSPILDANEAFGANVEKIIYCTLSVIWKAAVRDWNIFGTRKILLALSEKEQSELRQYLVGEAQAPKGLVCTLFLSGSRMPKGPVFAMPRLVETHPYKIIHMTLPGCIFFIHWGSEYPKELLDVCLINSKKFILTNKMFVAAERGLHETIASETMSKMGIPYFSPPDNGPIPRAWFESIKPRT